MFGGGGVDELGHLEDEVHLFILKMTFIHRTGIA